MKSTATWPERLCYSTKSNDCMIIGEESVSQSPSKKYSRGFLIAFPWRNHGNRLLHKKNVQISGISSDRNCKQREEIRKTSLRRRRKSGDRAEEEWDREANSRGYKK